MNNYVISVEIMGYKSMEILNYLNCLDFLEAEGLNVDLNTCMPAEESQACSRNEKALLPVH